MTRRNKKLRKRSNRIHEVDAKTIIEASANLLEKIQQERRAYDESMYWTRFGNSARRITIDGHDAILL